MKINLINIKILRVKTPKKHPGLKNGETIQVEIPRFDVKNKINKFFSPDNFFSFLFFSCDIDQKLTIDSQIHHSQSTIHNYRHTFPITNE